MGSSTVPAPDWQGVPTFGWACRVSSSRAQVPRPLVVSSDEELVDDVLRLLAVAGTEAERATGGPALRRAYRQAPLVLVGADALPAGVLRALPRRPGVVVVTARELPAADWAAAVEVGAERVALLPEDEAWLLSRASAAVRSTVERGPLVAVGGSCGGAGASTVAVAVALAAAPGAVLVDADAWGGGLDLLLGAERAEGLRWPDLSGLRGRVAADALLAALPEAAGVHVLAASRRTPVAVPPEALLAVLDAVRGDGRPVVVDLPRWEPAGEGSAVPTVLAEADLAVLVVPARLRAATAARLLVETPGSPWSSAQLVVRSVGGGLSPADVAEVVGRPVLVEVGHDRSAVPRGERGEPPMGSARSPLGRLARRVLAELAAAPGVAR
jgi:secretion/DNA translocation related CpaE-like protein